VPTTPMAFLVLLAGFRPPFARTGGQRSDYRCFASWKSGWDHEEPPQACHFGGSFLSGTFSLSQAFNASSFQHAANRDASWFFCSVNGLSFFKTVVSESWLESFSQHKSTGRHESHDMTNSG